MIFVSIPMPINENLNLNCGNNAKFLVNMWTINKTSRQCKVFSEHVDNQ